MKHAYYRWLFGSEFYPNEFTSRTINALCKKSYFSSGLKHLIPMILALCAIIFEQEREILCWFFFAWSIYYLFSEPERINQIRYFLARRKIKRWKNLGWSNQRILKHIKNT